MPGFGNNSQRSQNGGAFAAGAFGTKRFPLSSASSSFMPIVLTDAGESVSKSTSLHSGSLTSMDELYLWAVNNGASDCFLTISFDDDRTEGNQASQHTVEPVITKLEASGGATLIWPGIPIISLNETVPTVVYASGSASSKISVHGYIMRRNRVNPQNANQGYDGSE
jgi:hypothetical protein|tara:strand:- start:1547 stop:2047 length:501 start_codon:yes stop_codon:yes gene_type:complete